jgi:hypothetical protein
MIADSALAAAAVAALTPYLTAAGTEAAKQLGGEAVKGLGSLWGWVKDKLAGRASEKFEATPDDAKAQGALETALENLLSAQPTLAEELRALVGAAEPEAARLVQTTQTMNLSGGSKGVQNTGSNNTIKIG